MTQFAKYKACMWVALLLQACQYESTVGITSDASTCKGFQIPVGDCTLGGMSCNFDMECPEPNAVCNKSTNRCFQATDTCVGTPCSWDRECPSTERCNRATGTCYELSASQRCMPCSLGSDNCGTLQCDTEDSLCQ